MTEFVVGRYSRFDALAAKKRHPEVTLTLLLPYHPCDHPTPTPPGFDGMFYPPGMEMVPKHAAIVRANAANGTGLLRITAVLSTQCFGYCEPERPGVTCLPITGSGAVFIRGSSVGVEKVFGKSSWKF